MIFLDCIAENTFGIVNCIAEGQQELIFFVNQQFLIQFFKEIIHIARNADEHTHRLLGLDRCLMVS